ncbi:unnamed protein product [Fraxinus pennsylvanica]|uniref:25S rRNA (uridine-N(3))-methyltransferase BMT5-like domain-containing protein n=1 Tax=Fraxinus pennsylvanica TaxID=56036 RepID=A0AAD2DMH9_9LAMI|nr:unnamed protein product [Fraxinus pennsylvanica]
MGIVYSIIRSLGSKEEDVERSGEPYSCSFRASVCKIFKNLWRKILCIILFAKRRKPDPILPVENHAVLLRHSSDLSSDSSPSATYVPPSDSEWQRNYSDREIESRVNVDTYSTPSDLEWQRNYSDIEIESHVNVDTYSPPSDLVLQRDNSISENEVYANAAWLQKPPVSSLIRPESVEDEDSNYIKQLDVIIDVPTLQCSLAHTNAFDVVDSAVFIEYEQNQLGPDDSEEKVEEEKVIKCLVADGKWIKHYNSNHRILLVGEGDFSFSASLAMAFGSAPNIIATSLDSEDFLKKNYTHAMSNIQKLRNRESKVMHGIDATKISIHHLLGEMKFDRIIFNFPYAGFFKNLSREAGLSMHKTLVSLFLRNAKELISENGEIHITHKTNGFHAEWKLDSLASSHGLGLIEAVKFSHLDYPGYRTKYGFGSNENIGVL